MSAKDSELRLNVIFRLMEASTRSPYKDHFPNYTEGMYVGDPGGFVMLPGYVQNAEKIYNYPPKSDDVWIVTFPKCG